ncbi:MAG: hypothetical protein ABH823_02930 [bacterium]
MSIKKLISATLGAVVLLLYLISCSQTGTTPSLTIQTPIKGPDRNDGHMNDNDQVFRSLTVSNNSPEVVFIGTETNGIFKTTNGGATWTWLRNGLLHNNSSYPEVYDMAIHPNDNNILYAATLTGMGSSINGGTYKTIDGGTNWARKVTNINNNLYTSTITINPVNTDIIYTAVSYGIDDNGTPYSGTIYKSSDGGENWIDLALTSPGNTNRITQIVSPAEDTVYFLGTNSSSTSDAVGLQKSSDGGSNWSTINAPDIHITGFALAPSDPNTIYIFDGSSANVHKTTNEGTSWVKRGFWGGYFIAVSPTDPNTVFISHTNNLYKSTDGLATYQQVLTGEVNANISDIVIAPSDSNYVYAAQDHYLVYQSTDGGETFTQVADLRNFIDNY